MNRRANWRLSERFPFFLSPVSLRHEGIRPLRRRERTGSVSRVCVNKERDRVREVPPVTLLQIAMVSPGTHLVKNHVSLSRTNESQLKNYESEIENAWAFM